eukprot:TRINITY_DN5510_c0_g1_i1.p2 TRINITY_DN5510_c0_g1~~TRINITY_DN5510_c0_g1_i1.p2  ORF type:complete len:180 (+),score=0.91 TRINITY_DN5510_c0_g1_i1:562-1101(+)
MRNAGFMVAEFYQWNCQSIFSPRSCVYWSNCWVIIIQHLVDIVAVNNVWHFLSAQLNALCAITQYVTIVVIARMLGVLFQIILLDDGEMVVIIRQVWLKIIQLSRYKSYLKAGIGLFFQLVCVLQSQYWLTSVVVIFYRSSLLLGKVSTCLTVFDTLRYLFEIIALISDWQSFLSNIGG